MEKTTHRHSKQLEDGNTALLVIDVQQGLFEKSTPIYKAGELLQNITSLIERARFAGTPVFYIQHSDSKNLVMGSPDWQLHSRLQALPPDCVIHKQHGNAFEETDLEDILRTKNITKLIVTGLVTHGCVRATCLGALELGYDVTLVRDGHSSYSKQAATLIEEWNQKLSEKQADLKLASEIEFN